MGYRYEYNEWIMFLSRNNDPPETLIATAAKWEALWDAMLEDFEAAFADGLTFTPEPGQIAYYMYCELGDIGVTLEDRDYADSLRRFANWCEGQHPKYKEAADMTDDLTLEIDYAGPENALKE